MISGYSFLKFLLFKFLILYNWNYYRKIQILYIPTLFIRMEFVDTFYLCKL